MQLKRSSLRKYLLILFTGIIFYFSFDYIGDLMYKQMLGDHPEVILTAIHSAKKSPRIISRTGDISSDQYNLHMLGSSNDSLSLDMILEGEKATATIEFFAVKKISGVWEIYKSDTTFTE